MRTIRFQNALTQSLGLMCRKPRPKTLYVFSFKKPVQYTIHMFLVFWPIDVYFLDEERKVIEIQRNLLPFRWYTPKKQYSYVVETIPGLLKSRIGQSLE